MYSVEQIQVMDEKAERAIANWSFAALGANLLPILQPIAHQNVGSPEMRADDILELTNQVIGIADISLQINQGELFVIIRKGNLSPSRFRTMGRLFGSIPFWQKHKNLFASGTRE